MKEYFHSVGFGCDGWWLEVKKEIIWLNIGEAAAVVHQGCPVPIGDLDVVAWAGLPGGDRTTSPNSKVGELQPQYFSTLYMYCLGFVDVGKVVAWVVR